MLLLLWMVDDFFSKVDATFLEMLARVSSKILGRVCVTADFDEFSFVLLLGTMTSSFTRQSFIFCKEKSTGPSFAVNACSKDFTPNTMCALPSFEKRP